MHLHWVVLSVIIILIFAQIYTGDKVDILSASGRRVGYGTVTDQAVVHGRELKDGWLSLMVNDILPDTKPWDDFPTHTDIVEKNSFIAWPKSHVRSQMRKS